jgi:hypothetical protein
MTWQSIPGRRSRGRSPVISDGAPHATSTHSIPAHASPRLLERLAVLARDDPRELLGVLSSRLAESEEVPGARHDRRVAPGGERALRRGDGRVHVGAGRQRRPAR